MATTEQGSWLRDITALTVHSAEFEFICVEVSAGSIFSFNALVFFVLARLADVVVSFQPRV